MSGPRDRNSIDEQRSDGERSEGSRPDDPLVSDKSFEIYLQRDSVVSQSYRALEHEQPPEQLDASILSSAQAAVQERSTRNYRQWKKWTVPVALAASTVIAVSIVLESGMQHEVRSAHSVGMLEQESREVASEPINGVAGSSQPIPAPSSEATQSFRLETVLPHPPATQKPVQDQAGQEDLFALDAQSAPPAQAKVHSEGAAGEAATNAAAESEERKASVTLDSALARTQSVKRNEPTARGAAPSARSAAPAQTEKAIAADLGVSAKRSAASAPLRTPEVWLEQIRDLRETGKIGDADREWHAFTAAYPDFEVLSDDVARPAEMKE